MRPSSLLMSFVDRIVSDSVHVARHTRHLFNRSQTRYQCSSAAPLDDGSSSMSGHSWAVVVMAAWGRPQSDGGRTAG